MENNISTKDQEYIDLILEISPDEVFIVDLNNNRIITLNKAFADHLGCSCEEVIGKTFSEINLYDDIDEYKKLTSDLMNNGLFVSKEMDFNRKDGTSFKGLISAKTNQTK